jgi:sigma-E factor negative regulatory protein RseC
VIEENGRVVDAGDGYAWIETEPVSSCGSCAARKGCGTSALASLFGRRAAPLRVVNDINARIGDSVVIGIDEAGLVRGSLAVYAAPLAGLFAGGLLGRYTAAALLPQAVEPGGILGALAGLAAGLVWLRRFSRRTEQDGRYQPVILRMGTTSNPGTGSAADVTGRLSVND